MALLAAIGLTGSIACAAETRVSISGGRWMINGQLTYPGSPAEGLLMNVRMVNAVFQDAGRPGFDAEANTDEFIQQIPDYVAHGVRAFTICLQGGMPGYEGAVNSAFNSDGSLRDVYLRRVARVIEACDRAGAVVILGCYYQRQDQVLKDADAVRSGVRNVAAWIVAGGFANVVLEIANEFDHSGFDHLLLSSIAGEVELMSIARRAAPKLLVSTSGGGDGGLPEPIANAADFQLIHFNNTRIEDIDDRVEALRRYGKPIVCNEDDKLSDEGARAAQASVASRVSWGLMLEKHNQHFPFRFQGAQDDPIVYAQLKRLTSPDAHAQASNAYFPPPDAEGGWRSLASPAQVRRVAGLDRDKLDRAFDFIQGSSKNGGLLVVRHGWLGYERYFGLGHREATPNLASCGKSFTSIAVGILMRERPDLFPDGLDQKIFTATYLPPEAFPLSDPRKADITLGQLLAFTAGIRGNNPCYVRGMPQSIDPVGPDGFEAGLDRVALGKEESRAWGPLTSAVSLWCDPGEGYSYATSSIHIASIMHRHLTGRDLQDYVAEHLAKPLGWGRWGWGYRRPPQMTHTPGGGGIALRATDMLRFGYLLLHEGRWNDRQVIPVEFVRHATRQSPYNPHYPYSLQFNVNTNRDVATLPRDAFWKTGSGGHAFYVVPSLDLAVWKLGGRDGQYLPENSGLPVHPDAARDARPRGDWQELVDAETASVKTLEMVIDALAERGEHVPRVP
ncbi:MAG: serine hydrolase domain-containing protein [Planctomycetaceae bacterium]